MSVKVKTDQRYRKRVDIETPVASRTFDGHLWQYRSEAERDGGPVKDANDWLQSLRNVLGRGVRGQSIARVVIETRTETTTTVTHYGDELLSTFTPTADEYGNARWEALA